MNAWYADERFWQEFAPSMFSSERMEAGKEQAGQVLALAGVRQGAALDLCCGPCRVAAPLAAQGLKVTGVDASPYLLGLAEQTLAEQDVDVELVHQDMREFRRDQAFDLAVNLITSFGYFEDPDDDMRVLRNLHASLKPGGVLVMELMGKEVLARIHQPTISEVLADGTILVQRISITHAWTRVHAEWTLLRGAKAETFVLEHFVYSGRELEDRLVAAGFADVELFGGLDGSPYGSEAQRLVLRAGRPA